MFEYLKFEYGESMCGNMEIRLDYSDDRLFYMISRFDVVSGENIIRKEGFLSGCADFISRLEDFHVENWQPEYVEPGILDGDWWDITYKQTGRKSVHSTGSNDYPQDFDSFKSLIDLIFSRCVQDQYGLEFRMQR